MISRHPLPSPYLPTFHRVPDIPDLCRRTSTLIYPELAFDEYMFEASREVARCMPDDRWGHSVAAIGQMIYGRSSGNLTSIDCTAWPPSENGVLESLRTCRCPRAGLDYLRRMSAPAINGDWFATSQFLHLVNPTAFPFWSPAIDRHFDGNAANLGDRYAGWCDYAERTLILYERMVKQSVQRHLVTQITSLRALCLLVSWFVPDGRVGI